MSVRTRPQLLVLGTAAALMFLSPADGSAQAKRWKAQVDASATTLFGAASQTMAAFGASFAREGDDFSGDIATSLAYGESKDTDRPTFVSARNWSVATNASAFARRPFNPFLSGKLESSLERRVDRRITGGAGAKWRFTPARGGTASLSVALMGEHMIPLVPDTVVAVPSSFARWTCGLKAEQLVTERVRFTHLTQYAPVFNEAGRYTVQSTSSGSIDLSKAVALTLTVTNNYDSEATARGALSNSFGSILFGVRGRF